MRKSLLPVLILGLAVAATYANTLRNGFHLDDFYRIRDNPEIRHVSPVLRHFVDPGTISGSRGVSESALNQIGQYRPLLPLSLSLNYALGGLDLPGYHLANIALHLAGCILVFLLIARILATTRPSAGAQDPRNRWIALAVALVYAVHPLSGFPVNYILARDLLLMQAFALGALLVHASHACPRSSPWRWAVALALFELALLSKITAIAVPALIVAWECTIGGSGLRSWRPWRRAAPFAAIAALHVGLARLLLDFGELSRVEGGTAWSWTYALTQADVHVSEYLKNFFWPVAIRMAPLVAERTHLSDPRVLAGLVVVAGSLALAIRVRRSAPAASFAILGYWIWMAPESSLVPISHLAVHYRAFPSSWLLYLLVALLLVRVLRPRLALAFGAVALPALALLSVSLNRTYRTEESLWAHSLRHGGEALAHMNYAMSIEDRRDPRVRAHLERAVEMAPNYVLAHVNLGLLSIDLGAPDEGLERLRWTTRMAPDWPEAWYWRSIAEDRLGRVDDAATSVAHALALDPANLEYAYRLGVTRARAVDYAGSLDAAREVLAIDPAHAPARFLEAFALQMTGATEAATRAFVRYLEARPDDLQARFDLAYAWITLGRCDRAEPELRAIVAASAEHALAGEYLALCERERGGGPSAARQALSRQYEAAFAAYRAGDWRRSLEFVHLVEAVDPAYGEAGFLKGFDLQMLGRLDEAIAAYGAYLELRPDDPQVHFNIAHALATVGRCHEAAPHLERALERWPDHSGALDLRARCAGRDDGLRAAATGPDPDQTSPAPPAPTIREEPT